MTFTLELTAAELARLEAEARAVGLNDPEQYVRMLIDTAPRRTGRPQTGAELADALEALNLPAGYGDPNIVAPELARQLAARMSRPTPDAVACQATVRRK